MGSSLSISPFLNVSKLKEIPDISKWNTNNLYEIDGLFQGCASLIYLPDISKWNISKVKYLCGIFYGCSSLEKIPDISK